MVTRALLRKLLKRIRILMPTMVIMQQSYTHALYEQILKNHLTLQSMRNKQQEAGAKRSQGPLNTIRSIRKVSLHLYKILLIANILLFIKYIMIEVLSNSGILQRYRFIDCFLLGRFRFIGRTNRISSWMALWALVTFLGMQTVNSIPFSRRFRFHFIEFLWYDFEEVARIETSYQQAEAARESKRWPETARNGDHFCGGRIPADLGHWSRDNSLRASGLEVEFNPLFHIMTEHEQIILRPNRDTDCWLRFDRLTKRLFFVMSLGLIAWILLLTWLIAGSLLTTIGFELAYSSCVKWLRDEQRRDPEVGAFVYRTSSKLADEIPFDQLPTIIKVTRENLSALSIYNLLRICVDITENYLIYMEFTLACWCTFYLVLCASIDVIHNAARIRVITLKLLEHFRRRYHIEQSRTMLFRRLSHDKAVSSSKLCAKLRARKRNLIDWPRPMGSPLAFSYPLEPSLVLILDDDEEQLEAEIDHVQAILVDHFKLIHSYNIFVSYVLNLPIGCWISYTIIICIWMGRIRHLSVDAEFKIAQAGALVTTFSVMVTAVIARSQNRDLYPLISTLMALDLHRVFKRKRGRREFTRRLLKFRWMSIMKFYFPKPTFCFTLYGSTEVSWLFCVQLASWITSVFLVLANFFYSFQARFSV